jgi:hypothetical protein
MSARSTEDPAPGLYDHSIAMGGTYQRGAADIVSELAEQATPGPGDYGDASEPFPRDECRSCRAAILWCFSNVGRRMPVDFDPHPEGSVAVTREPFGLLAKVVSAKLRFGRKDLRRPHFQTCPSAETHRKRAARAARYR